MVLKWFKGVALEGEVTAIQEELDKGKQEEAAKCLEKLVKARLLEEFEARKEEGKFHSAIPKILTNTKRGGKRIKTNTLENLLGKKCYLDGELDIDQENLRAWRKARDDEGGGKGA